MHQINPKSAKNTCSDPQKSHHDITIYSGIGGYLALYIRIHQNLQEGGLLNRVPKLEKNILKRIKHTIESIERHEQSVTAYKNSLNFQPERPKKPLDISFYMGTPGTLSLKFVHYHMTQNFQKAQNVLNKILEFYEFIIEDPDSKMEEILYGIPGFVHCLLYITKNCIITKKSGPGDFEVKQELNEIYNTFGMITAQLVDFCFRKGLQNYISNFFEESGTSTTNRTGKVLCPGHLPNNFRLSYFCFSMEYLGAAHGLAGNLTVFFEAIAYFRNSFKEYYSSSFYQASLVTSSLEGSLQSVLRQKIKKNAKQGNSRKAALILKSHLPYNFQFLLECLFKSLEYAIDLQSSEGSFPSIVQVPEDCCSNAFCHGAPGFVTPICLALENPFFPTQKSQKFRKALKLAVKCVWKKGLHLKGWGLCHGVSGNGYALLRASRLKAVGILSEEERGRFYRMSLSFGLTKVLNQEFVEASKNFDDGRRNVVGMSDFPLSLMLGTAGDLVYYIDILESSNAKGYDKNQFFD